MKLTVKNQTELTAWINKRMELGHDIMAIKGPPPVGATYEDGELIVRPVNIRWRDISSGEVFDIDYCDKAILEAAKGKP